MNNTIGASQTSLTNTSTADTGAHNYYVARWVSPLLYQGNISAQTWTYNFAASEGNTNANFPCSGTNQVLRVNCYIWKPSDGTKVGTILDGNTAAAYDENTTASVEIVEHGTFTGAAVTGMTPGDAVVVFEMWFVVTQAMGSGYAQTVFFDGTTENTTKNTTVSNHASFISTPEDLEFTQTAANMTVMVVSKNAKISTANTTQYLCPFGELDSLTTTENEAKFTVRRSGTLSRLAVRITANSIAGNTTFTVRKNGADTSLVATAPASTTGYFEDITNTITVASGDQINLKSVPGAATGTFTIYTATLHFTADSDEQVQILGSSSLPNSLTTASTTRYIPIAGRSAHTGTEANTKMRQLVDGTYSKLYVYVGANARTTNTVFKSRKNGADGNLSVTYASGETGVKEDTSNSDTVTAGDDYNVAVTTSTGTESLNYTVVKVEFANTLYKGMMSSANTGSSNVQNFNTTQVYSLGGTSVPIGAGTNYRRKVRNTKLLLSNLHVLIASNTVTANSTATLLVNGTASALTCTITASTNGLFSDTSNTVTVGASDEIDVQIVTGASGTSMAVPMITVYYHTGRVSLSRIYKHNVLGRISLSRIYKWHLLSRVSLSRIYKWNLLEELARVSLERIYKYNVQARVSLSRIYKYNLLGRVSLSRIYKYNVIGRLSLLRVYKYNVIGRLSLSRIYKYNIIGRVSLSRIYRYHLLGRVSLSRIYKFHVAARVSLARIYKYHILGRVSLSRIYKYNIIGRVSLARTYLWNVLEEGLTRVSLSRIYKYNVTTRVSLARIYKYHLLGRVSLSRIYKYHLLGRTSLSRIYRYNVIGRVSLSRIYKYHLQSRVSLSRIYKYHVLGRISLARIYKYHVAVRVSLSRIYKYNLIARVSLARVYKWNILSALERISKQQIYKYNLIGRLSVSRVLKYNVLARVSLSRIYLYHVFVRLSSQRILKYNVIARVALSRIYKYNILAHISLPRIYKYNLLQRISLSRVYKWNVILGLFRVSKEQILKYNVIGRLSAQLRIKYNIATLAVTQWGKVVEWLYARYQEDDPAKR